MVFFSGREFTVYYADEVVEGITDSSDTFKVLGQHQSVTISEAPTLTTVPKSGDVDLADIGKGTYFAKLMINGSPDGTDGKLFLRDRISSDTPMTFVCKGGGLFFRITGCKCKNANVRGSIYQNPSPVEYELEIWGWITLFTDAPGVPIYNATVNTFMNWSDVTVKIATVTLVNWWSFSFRVENDLEVIPDNLGAVAGIKRGIRSVNGEIDHALVDNASTQFTEARAATSKLIEIDITATPAWDFVASRWSEVEVRNPMDGVSGRRLSFIAAQFSAA